MSKKLKSASAVDDAVDSSNNKINTNKTDDNNTDKKETPNKTIKVPVEPTEENNLKTGDVIPFWTENPNILFDKTYMFEFFPIETMTYEQKLNAVTRTTIILTIIGYLLSSNMRVLIIGVITVLAIFLMFYYRKKEEFKTKSNKAVSDLKEGFDNPAQAFLKENNMPINNVFMSPSSRNPYSNVLVTDYNYNPNKKPAPPAFNSMVNEDIKKQTMKMVAEINNDQPNITKKLYKDLGEELEFDQSLRQFYSNPSTTIPNDQSSFAEFCYGNMVSCKEGNLFACAKNKVNYNNY